MVLLGDLVCELPTQNALCGHQLRCLEEVPQAGWRLGHQKYISHSCGGEAQGQGGSTASSGESPLLSSQGPPPLDGSVCLLLVRALISPRGPLPHDLI